MLSMGYSYYVYSNVHLNGLVVKSHCPGYRERVYCVMLYVINTRSHAYTHADERTHARTHARPPPPAHPHSNISGLHPACNTHWMKYKMTLISRSHNWQTHVLLAGFREYSIYKQFNSGISVSLRGSYWSIRH